MLAPNILLITIASLLMVSIVSVYYVHMSFHYKYYKETTMYIFFTIIFLGLVLKLTGQYISTIW